MKITELQNLNKDYNFLMDFIGLAELRNELGLTENSTDQLEYLECALYETLDIEEKGAVGKTFGGLKRTDRNSNE